MRLAFNRRDTLATAWWKCMRHDYRGQAIAWRIAWNFRLRSGRRELIGILSRGEFALEDYVKEVFQ